MSWNPSEPAEGALDETVGVPARVHPSVVQTTENDPGSVGIFTVNAFAPFMDRYFPEYFDAGTEMFL